MIALSTGLSQWLSWVAAGEPSKGLSDGLGAALGWGPIVAGSYWLLIGLLQGVSSTSFREQQRTIPNQGIRRSGRNGLVMGLLAGSIAAVIGGVGFVNSRALFLALSFWPSGGLSIELLQWLYDSLCFLPVCLFSRAALFSSDALNVGWQVGLAVGLSVTLLMGGLAWWRHWVLRFLLCRNGALSWHLVPLLDEAAHRTLLRKVGGGYRFIHDLFRDYLATLEPLVLSGAVAQGVPQIDTTYREETASPPAPSRRTGFNQEKRIAALLNVVILLIALASGVSIFSGVHQSVQDANDARATATAYVVAEDATATAQPEANSTAEALANASPIAYPTHNQFPVLNDPLEDIDSQVGTGGASNGVCEFIHQFADISTPTKPGQMRLDSGRQDLLE